MATSLNPSWPRVYAGMALTATATLLLELSLTRIFSVVLFYHFAFLAISVALFGMGTGALCSYWLTARFSRVPVWSLLGILSGLNLPVTAGSLVFVLRRKPNLELTGENLWTLALIYFVSAAPFFLAGAVLSLVVEHAVERVDRVYFYDLGGAAGGCLILVPLLNLLGGPGTVLAAATLYGLAGALWCFGGGRRAPMILLLILSGVMAVFTGWNVRTRWVDVIYAKGRPLAWEVFSRWNSFSRVGVKADDGAGNPAIVIDGDAATSIPNYSAEISTPDQREQWLREGPSLPYRLRPGAVTLIIGPGGGFDVARALASGSTDVTGVEINPIIVNDIMKERFADRSQRLYFRPEVRIHVEDGRSFVRRTDRAYQVIQMTLVDTWASTAAGAFALSENNLYTTEAFLDYLDHLTADGLLAITRWEFEPPRESLRVVSLALAALRERGASQPWRHFLVGRENAQDASGYGAKDTVLVKRNPFTPAEITRAREAVVAAGMTLIYAPEAQIANPFTELILSAEPQAFTERYRFDVSPVSDDRPFFFYTVRLPELWKFVTLQRSEDVKINLGVVMLLASLAVSTVATAVVLILPPLVLRVGLPRERGAFLHLAYFFAIGVGFIIVEVALIQKFVLFLGLPTYSLTVVVFGLLMASGLGSYASRRLIGGQDRRLALVLSAIAILVVALAVVVPAVVSAAVRLPLAIRCLIAAALVFPAGFAMGMPFPSGLKRLEGSYRGAIRWAWAMNSASSVLGSVLAVFLAIHVGLSRTLLLGGACYLLALAALQLAAARTAKLRPARH